MGRRNPSPHLPCIMQKSLLVAILAGGWPLLHVCVATLTGFMCPILAKPLNLARSLLVALLAVTYSSLVSLVVEFDVSLHLDNIGAKCGSGKG